jgi:hypothetical protein
MQVAPCKPCCPSESSTALVATSRCRIGASSRNSLLVHSSWPAEVPPALVGRSRFAVGRFLGCTVFLRRAALMTLSLQCTLSASFAFLQSFQHGLVRRPQPVDTSLGLSFPSAHAGSEVHKSRALPGPATLRLQGLATLLAPYSLRAPAGFVSHRRRSWDSPFGASSSRKVAGAFPHRSHPHTVCPVGDPGPTSRAGPAQRAAVSGL